VSGEVRGPAVDPEAPYARLAVVGLICRSSHEEEGSDAGADCGVAEGGRWLLLRRREGPERWDPPGGRVERSEDLEQAVKREVREETGLEVQVAGPCYAYLTFYKGERLLAVSMACRLDAGGPDPDDVRVEPEFDSWAWRTTAEWADLAAEGRSSWRPTDVRRIARLAARAWEADE